MLIVQQLTKHYQRNKVITNLSFEVNDGEILGIIGRNNSGKTTIMRLLAGLITSYSGTATYDGKSLAAIPKLQLGYYSEKSTLQSDLTIVEQLVLLGKLRKMEEADIYQAIDYWLEKMRINRYRQTVINKLSKGTQQKVQLIAALIHKPQIIVLDELFDQQNENNTQLYLSLVAQLRQEHKIVIISGSQSNLIGAVSDKLLVVHQGECIYYGYSKDMESKQNFAYITTTADMAMRYASYSGVIGSTHRGDYVRLKMASDDSARQLGSELLANESVLSFKYEQPTINDIVKDLLLE